MITSHSNELFMLTSKKSARKSRERERCRSSEMKHSSKKDGLTSILVLASAGNRHFAHFAVRSRHSHRTSGPKTLQMTLLSRVRARTSRPSSRRPTYHSARSADLRAFNLLTPIFILSLESFLHSQGAASITKGQPAVLLVILRHRNKNHHKKSIAVSLSLS